MQSYLTCTRLLTVVEVSWVRLTKAMEATVDIRIQELAQQHHRNNGGGGLDGDEDAMDRWPAERGGDRDLTI